MNLDDLTIGEARKLAALFGGSGPASPTIGAELIGRMVVVRSRGSGVWMGILREVAYPAAGMIVRLDTARRLWSWSGAKECSELALTGPTGGNIGCVSAPVVSETLEMHECAPAAVAALGKVPVWTQK